MLLDFDTWGSTAMLTLFLILLLGLLVQSIRQSPMPTLVRAKGVLATALAIWILVRLSS